ncbi:MAG TPA: hypothetical protein VFA72_17675 [Burkholderiales bacterium]|nr:hypothetical protein [Burkholderiales bacterium]
MLLVNSEKLLRLLGELHTMRGILLVKFKDTDTITLSVDDSMREQAAEMEQLAVDLGLEMTAKKIARLKDLFEKDKVDDKEGVSRIQAVLEEIEDELSVRSLWLLTPEDHKLIGNPQPFGPIVASKLQDANEDIEEAAKCLAFNRGIACVLHLMRAMEHALRAFATALKAMFKPTDDWHVILKEIQAKIDALPMGLHAEVIYKDKCREVHADLGRVKLAWRHPGMHSRGYWTVEQAREIFAACRAFMHHVAEVC